MGTLLKRNLARQVADHILDEIRTGVRHAYLPGVSRLADEFSVSKDSIREALNFLTKAGHLKESQAGRRREIIQTPKPAARQLKVGILLAEPLAFDNRHSLTLMNLIRSGIERNGHLCFFAERSQQEFRGKLERLKKMILEASADAWVLYAPRKSLALWFSKAGIPIFCIGGYTTGFPSYHLTTHEALGEVTRAFIRNGHRKIVFVTPERWRKPVSTRMTMAFETAMREAGLPFSSYNLPDWDGTQEGLHDLLENLFRLTPPTGLMVVEPGHAMAVISFLGKSSLRVPEDVSLFSMIGDPLFRWFDPPLDTLDSSFKKQVPCILEWLESLVTGNELIKKTSRNAHHLPGRTIGPVKPGRAGH